MAVTLSLAFSMKRLMKQNTLPRTMHACETMGAVSVICSDKTGTLTQNQMTVVDTLFAGLNEQKLGDDRTSALLKECIAINTTANLDYSDTSKIKTIGNPTEGALLLWLNKQGVNYLVLRESLEVIDRIQFTTELKYMATIVRSAVSGTPIVYVKGAPDILMNMCALSDDDKKVYNNKLAEYQSHANRTLAFAYKEIKSLDNVFVAGKLAVNDLSMMGIVGIEDPVRADVPAAIADCLNAGIQVKIVTGDAPGTAKELGLLFTIFVMLQFWNMFNAKAFMTSDSAFKGISWGDTKWFIVIALVIFVGQVLMTECPGLQEMFNVAEGGVKMVDWVIITIATSFVLWIGEVLRLLRK